MGGDGDSGSRSVPSASGPAAGASRAAPSGSGGRGGRPRQPRGAAGFDRIKPPGRRVPERPAGPRPEGRESDAEGRAALFTSRSAAPGRQGQESAQGLRIHCSRCGATSALDARSALRAALPLFVVNPWRDHPVFAVCPACRHRAWLKPGVA